MLKDNPCQAQALCANSGSVFVTKDSLQTAINDYLFDREVATALYGRMNCWDVSAITDMSYLFQYQSYMNEDISCWDVSNVTDMQYMFLRASAFNQGIGGWNVSNVENMNYMFGNYWWDYGSFNQYIGDWNVSKVRYMSGMFYYASAFNQDLGSWNVSQAEDFSNMFYGATAFNQSLCDWFNSFSSNSPSVNNMFYSSGCPIKLQPNFSSKINFCQKCHVEGQNKIGEIMNMLRLIFDF
jgi:surface protein